jgi:hypothetical protein
MSFKVLFEPRITEAVSRVSRAHGSRRGQRFGPKCQCIATSGTFIAHCGSSFVGGGCLVHCRLPAGRRFGLIGQNGIGKTTLLRHLSSYRIEGFPKHLKVLHVEQEVLYARMLTLPTHFGLRFFCLSATRTSVSFLSFPRSLIGFLLFCSLKAKNGHASCLCQLSVVGDALNAYPNISFPN